MCSHLQVIRSKVKVTLEEKNFSTFYLAVAPTGAQVHVLDLYFLRFTRLAEGLRWRV